MRACGVLLLAVVVPGCMLSPVHLVNRPSISRVMPAGVQFGDYVEHGPLGHKVTVEEKLARLGAHVRDGKLYDVTGRPITFFRHYDGGMQPPAGMLEQMDAELKRLKKDHTVIEIYRDPDLPLPV
jgi:hypothetical protein